MTIKLQATLPSTGCPSFELKLGEPSDLCVSIKLPRTTLDKDDLLTHHRVVVMQGGTLSVSESYFVGFGTFVKVALRKVGTVFSGHITIIEPSS